MLGKGEQSANFGLRVIHGGVVTDHGITISAGFQVTVSAQNVRQNFSTFSVQIRNAPSGFLNNVVTERWYLDGVLRSTNYRFAVRNGTFTVRTPNSLLRGNVQSDVFQLVITVGIGGTPFKFNMTVYKNTTPVPGNPQTVTTAPAASKQNSLPLLPVTSVAKGATTYQLTTKVTDPNGIDAQDMLLNQSRHQLVILCYGAGEVHGDVDSSKPSPFNVPGMDQVFDAIKASVPLNHIMLLCSGDQPWKNPYYSPDQALSDAKALIRARLNSLNSPDSDQRIDDIVIVGYSWGGSMAKELANYITSTYNPQHNAHIEISGLMYIDAVHHGQDYRETSLPDVTPGSFLSISQSVTRIIPSLPVCLPDDLPVNDSSAVIINPGLPLGNDTNYYGRFQQINVESAGYNIMTHTQIDNLEKNTVIDFIEQVLFGWYSTHST